MPTKTEKVLQLIPTFWCSFSFFGLFRKRVDSLLWFEMITETEKMLQLRPTFCSSFSFLGLYRKQVDSVLLFEMLTETQERSFPKVFFHSNIFIGKNTRTRVQNLFP